MKPMTVRYSQVKSGTQHVDTIYAIGNVKRKAPITAGPSVMLAAVQHELYSISNLGREDNAPHDLMPPGQAAAGKQERQQELQTA